MLTTIFRKPCALRLFWDSARIDAFAFVGKAHRQAAYTQFTSVNILHISIYACWFYLFTSRRYRLISRARNPPTTKKKKNSRTTQSHQDSTVIWWSKWDSTMSKSIHDSHVALVALSYECCSLFGKSIPIYKCISRWREQSSVCILIQWQCMRYHIQLVFGYRSFCARYTHTHTKLFTLRSKHKLFRFRFIQHQNSKKTRFSNWIYPSVLNFVRRTMFL